MNDFMKVLVFVFVMLYVVSPIDLCPGPIDDLIIIGLSLAARKGNNIIE